MDYQKTVEALHAPIYAKKFYTLDDLREVRSAIPVPKHGDHWGRWYLSTTQPPSLDFHIPRRAGKYEIPIYEIYDLRDTYTNCPGLMRWIKHLHAKDFARDSRTAMSDFVDAALTIGARGFMDGEERVRVWPVSASEYLSALK